jgi:hypothetical protein
MHSEKGSAIQMDWQNNLHLDLRTVKPMETLTVKYLGLLMLKVKEMDFRSEIPRRKLTEIMTDWHLVKNWDLKKD